ARALENDVLHVVVLPELGAKLASLLDKRTNHEWLLSLGARPVKPVAYGATFTRQDMSGWDEMFPTIDACPYPAPGPYQGQPLPDHGEVWSLPWHGDTASDRLSLSVQGKVIPYTLSRTMTLAENQVILSYSLSNPTADELIWLWATHPQFTVMP